MAAAAPLIGEMLGVEAVPIEYKDDGRRAEAIAQFRKYLTLRPDASDVETVKDDIYYLQEESRRAP